MMLTAEPCVETLFMNYFFPDYIKIFLHFFSLYIQ